jgi:periplasmic protein TonB
LSVSVEGAANATPPGETRDSPACGAGIANGNPDWCAFARWSSCAAVAILAHLLMGIAVLRWETDSDVAAPTATILMELSPAVPAPLVQELPPAPEQVEAAVPPPRMVDNEADVERNGVEETFKPQLEMTPFPPPEPPPQVDAVAIAPRLPQPSAAETQEDAGVQLPPPQKQDEGKPVDAPQPASTDTSLHEQTPPPERVRSAADRPRKPAPDRTVMRPQATRAETAPTRGPDKSTPSNSNALPNWRSQVVDILERNRHYPPEAQARGEHGVSNLAFSLNRQGRVTSARIAGSSGSAALDAETLALVRRVQPFPPPPPEVPGAQITVVVAIRYR